MMGEMLTTQLSLTYLEPKVYFNQPLYLHRKCDQSRCWKFSYKGDKDRGRVQKPVLCFAAKTLYTFETFLKASVSSSGVCRAGQQPG